MQAQLYNFRMEGPVGRGGAIISNEGTHTGHILIVTVDPYIGVTSN